MDGETAHLTIVVGVSYGCVIMKIGFVVSSVGHAAILLASLVSLSGPKPFDVEKVDAIPIDIVPISDLSEVTKGNEKAKKITPPEPSIAKQADVVKEAQSAGEQSIDAKKPVDVPQKKPEQKPAKKPLMPMVAARKTEPDIPAKRDPVSQPKTKPQPKQDIVVPPKFVESKPAEKTEQPALEELSDKKHIDIPKPPLPTARPQPPKRKIKIAKTEPREIVKNKASDFDTDDIAALINKNKASSAGADKSKKVTSLGRKNGQSNQLSQSEIDALRGQIEPCWNPPIGTHNAEALIVRVKMHLNRDGSLARPPVVLNNKADPVFAAAAGATHRAIIRCAPYALPADKYEIWETVIVNFDPSQLLGF